MPITIHKIKKRYNHYGLRDMSSMSTTEYQQILANGALFWIDQHGFLRSTFSGQI